MGSSSVARYDLLVAAGLKPNKVLAPNINEAQRNLESPTDYVTRMAIDKANSIDVKITDLLITADTIVVVNRNLFEDVVVHACLKTCFNEMF